MSIRSPWHSWPSSGTVLFDRYGIDATRATFSEYRNGGEHETATPKSAEEAQAMRPALVPAAGKQIARRSPEAARTIEFLGGPYETESTWQAQLGALRRLLDGFATLGRPDSLTAAHAYLELLEQTLREPPQHDE